MNWSFNLLFYFLYFSLTSQTFLHKSKNFNLLYNYELQLYFTFPLNKKDKLPATFCFLCTVLIIIFFSYYNWIFIELTLKRINLLCAFWDEFEDKLLQYNAYKLIENSIVQFYLKLSRYEVGEGCFGSVFRFFVLFMCEDFVHFVLFIK